MKNQIQIKISLENMKITCKDYLKITGVFKILFEKDQSNFNRQKSLEKTLW